MNKTNLTAKRVREILSAASRCRIAVVGDVMLDQFIWGDVSRISPEAPVPIVEFLRESFMPGGAANVARNLTALNQTVAKGPTNRMPRTAGHCRTPDKRQNAHRSA